MLKLKELRGNVRHSSYGIVSSVPDVSYLKIPEEAEVTFVIATDGLWDKISSDEAMEVALSGITNPAKKLVDMALTSVTVRKDSWMIQQ